MSQFPNIHLPLKAKLTFTANPVSIVPIPNGEILVNFASQPLITKLDNQLQIVWEKILQGQTVNYVSSKLSASPDGRQMAIAGISDMRILDGEGTKVLHTVAHQPWGYFLGSACYFSTDSKTIWFVIPGVKEENNDELQVLDATTYELLATHTLEGRQEYAYNFHATPHADKILLEASAGQDTNLLKLVEWNNGQITITDLPQCNDCIMGNFSPSGKEFVTAPHYDGPAVIFSFPAFEQVASVTQDDIFLGSLDYPAHEPDGLNYTIFFLDDKRILTFSEFGRLLVLDRESLRVSAELMPEGISFTAYDYDGRPTTTRDRIFDYSSNIITITVVHGKLLITTSEGVLCSYALNV
ncbi:MAG: hypothetical protein JO154_23840 [Chitinophaga sp.]|uniref:hypothetical protein n=1 Tax=Chitinophaga sp. TaxID=1869181 RepID=UPI0025BD307A|nr:hypothetical protein [Chitinophaga sp.]MBV8255646.1 hypothetical protein [Chitinophaga sp.]